MIRAPSLATSVSTTVWQSVSISASETASDTSGRRAIATCFGLRPLPDQADQVVVGQDLGKLKHRQRDAVDVLGEVQRHVVGHLNGELQVGRQCLADHRGGVLDHRPQDVLDQPALGRRQAVAVDLRRKLRREAGPGVRAGIRQQSGDIVARQVMGHGIGVALGPQS